jgi:hypothetical protein
MKKLLFVIGIVWAANTAHAQIEAPVHWSYAAKKTSPTQAAILLKATIDRDWHIYSQQKIKLKASGIKVAVKGKLQYMACNDNRCLPPQTVDFSVAI